MKLIVDIPDEIHAKLKTIKINEGKSFQYIINKLLQNYFKNRKINKE